MEGVKHEAEVGLMVSPLYLFCNPKGHVVTQQKLVALEP